MAGHSRLPSSSVQGQARPRRSCPQPSETEVYPLDQGVIVEAKRRVGRCGAGCIASGNGQASGPGPASGPGAAEASVQVRVKGKGHLFSLVCSCSIVRVRMSFAVEPRCCVGRLRCVGPRHCIVPLDRGIWYSHTKVPRLSGSP